MIDDDTEKNFLAHSKSLLDKSIDAIDTDTAAQLRTMRYQALEHKPKTFNWPTPYAAFATTAAVLMLTVSLWLTQPAEVNDARVLEDIPMLTSGEELDFYQDLEFYNWLDDEQING
ncbi:MAG: hypothetical protein OEY61_02970 [Gammaproteobacteria bacterium]|nr:hypothetical protein [Gammaproteobacteria bacterium]